MPQQFNLAKFWLGPITPLGLKFDTLISFSANFPKESHWGSLKSLLLLLLLYLPMVILFPQVRNISERITQRGLFYVFIKSPGTEPILPLCQPCL